MTITKDDKEFIEACWDVTDFADLEHVVAVYKAKIIAASHRVSEREAWDKYAANCCCTAGSIAAGLEADALLEERRKRFPGP